MNGRAKFLAKGPAHVTLLVPQASLPAALDVAFVLLPRFTMLAFALAIEPLRIANR
jgi:AraC family transcriptional regulator, glycine betaine-responsive activator